MRRFFFDLLNSLDKLTGMKQMEKLQTCDNPEKEIGELLDILCRVSDQFPIIPKRDQQNIIQQSVIADPEFKGLNAHMVYKWLSASKDKYFRESHHQPSEVDPTKDNTPLTGEARQAMLQKWMETLGGFQPMIATQSHVKEWERTLPEKKGQVYRSTAPETLFEKELHLQWIRENFDKNGDKLPGWQPEREWIQKQMEK